ncbi:MULTISPECIES: response regulator transcription factor [Sciscionella]|uniref:response regulator transcription factor n=1 Tax=Sciscionella TaxID=596495 RepID=UPI0012F6E8BD|nr:MULTISPECIES: response regulator transcription factor [Sciscionella]
MAAETVDSAIITALVVDAEPLFAEGIREQFTASRQLRYQGRIGRVREVLPTCARLAPDLVLLDAMMDESCYLTATLKGAQHPPIVAVLVPEPLVHGSYADRVLAAGADLLLPRTVAGTELLGGIDRVRRRSPVVHPALGGQQRIGRPGNRPAVHWAITQRQFEVLCLMADGKRNEVIAEELFVAPETVRTHVKGIRHALKATSRAHAVSRAFELGLLPVEPLPE